MRGDDCIFRTGVHANAAQPNESVKAYITRLALPCLVLGEAHSHSSLMAFYYQSIFTPWYLHFERLFQLAKDEGELQGRTPPGHAGWFLVLPDCRSADRGVRCAAVQAQPQWRFAVLAGGDWHCHLGICRSRHPFLGIGAPFCTCTYPGCSAALCTRVLSNKQNKIAIPAAAVQALVVLAGAASIFTPHNTIENTACPSAPKRHP